MTDSGQAHGPESKDKIFISYSHRNVAFVDRLETALRQRGYEPLIDRSDISKFEDWWKRIEELIIQSDTVIFVITNDAIQATSVCQKEVTYAQSLNKRLAPILRQEVDHALVPEQLKRLNWIDFQNDDNFDLCMDSLTAALEIDIDWIRRHTQFGEIAQRWHNAGRPGVDGLMLRPPLLAEAEAWLNLRPRTAPQPTDILLDFITESRAAFDQEQVDMLAQVADAQRITRNMDSALRLSIHCVRREYETRRRTSRPSKAAATLAATVCQSNLRLTLSRPDSVVRSAAFSPDGEQIVTALDDKTVRTWNAKSGSQIAAISGHRDTVNSAVFNSDGLRIVSASDDNTARISDAMTGETLAVLRGHGDSVFSAAFSPDDAYVVTASHDQTARIWDTASAKTLAVLRHQDQVMSAAFSPDGLLIVTGSGDFLGKKDNTARVWTVGTAKQIAVLRGHEDTVTSVAFSRDGSRIVTASADLTVRVWKRRAFRFRVFGAAYKEIAILRGHDGEVLSAAFSPDGTRVVTAAWDRTARIWDAATGAEIAVVRGHEDAVNSVCFGPDGSQILTASNDKTARIWGAAAMNEMILLLGHEDIVDCATFSPDGSLILTESCDGTSHIWDANTGKPITDVDAQEQHVEPAAVSPDGSFVAGSHDMIAHIRDVATRKAVSRHGHPSGWTSGAFSADGQRVVTAVDTTASVRDTATDTEIAVLRGHDKTITCVAFSPDGKQIVTASTDRTARIWDAATGNVIAVMRGHDSAVQSSTFDPGGKRVVTASDDYTARIWDPATATELACLRGHKGCVLWACFSPDGRRVVTASEDKTARVWNSHFATMLTKDLVTEVCSRRLRGLTNLSRDEMRLAGYPDTVPEIDVCKGFEMI